MRKLLSAALLILFLFTLVSCGYDEEDIPVFYIKNGTEAYDPAEEMIDNFYSTFYDESESDEPDESKVTQASDSTDYTETAAASEPNDTQAHVDDGTVYWVKNGEVWHRTDKCSSLSRSKNIRSGTVEDAMLAGKKRQCKVCYE